MNHRLPIFIGGTYWTLNGVNIFSENLARGLRARGYDARILLTEDRSQLITIKDPHIPRPADIPFIDLPVTRSASWGAHWGAMIRFLENHAPCIYLPNSDYRHSAIIPLLSSRVGVIGIIHSDDPLHYDHANRLGAYWTRIVCTSRTIERRFLAQNPASARRLLTIPIGVTVPPAIPAKALPPDLPLRLIYHGALKRHQKRVFDLIAIMTRLARAKLPVQLTIAGGGPDSDELRAAAAPLVDQGYIRFLGVVPHQQMGAILEQQHVYLLTSDFEGMPNALLEAMGRGCIPIVTAMDSAIPELVTDGINGFIVAIGDIAAFAGRIQLLHNRPGLIRLMSKAAYGAVASGQYRVDNMVDSYCGIIDEVAADSEMKDYQRPIGQLNPPPDSLANETVFPVQLSQKIPKIGVFPPSIREVREFVDQLRGIADRRSARIYPLLKNVLSESVTPRQKLKGRRVIVASPMLLRNGVNIFAIHLVRGLQDFGIDARLLITEENSDLISIAAPRLSIPADIRVDFLPVAAQACWGERWGAMIRYLEGQAPCFYLPNYDWRHSCVCPLLPRSVITIGILHKDEELYYDHYRRLNRYWNAIVAADTTIFSRLTADTSAPLDRLVVIPSGIDIPPVPTRSDRDDAPCRLAVIAALAADLQPGLDLLSSLAQVLPEAKLNLIVIDGDTSLIAQHAVQLGWTVDDCRREAFIATSLARFDIVIIPRVFVDFTALLAEAMGQGCIPLIGEEVAAAIDTTIIDPAAIHAVYCDGSDLCRRLVELNMAARRQASLAAAAHVAAKCCRVTEMILDYIELFQRCLSEQRHGKYRRDYQTLSHPPAQLDGIDLFPVPLDFSDPIFGSFPAEQPDFAAFCAQMELPVRNRPEAKPDHTAPAAQFRHRFATSLRELESQRVIVATPMLLDNGVSTFAINLVRGLQNFGIDARLLITEEYSDLISIAEPRLSIPADIRVDFLPVAAQACWGEHWGAMIRYLEGQAPCFYLPNYDWRHSCVCPLLPLSVITIGILHQDEELYYDHYRRLNRYWNAIVAADSTIYSRLTAGAAAPLDRLVIIPSGDDTHPATAPSGPDDASGRPAAIAADCSRTADMVLEYIKLFQRCLDEQRHSRYRRDHQPLSHPPAHLDGIDLFPVPLAFNDPTFGSFPAEYPDFASFCAQITLPVRARPEAEPDRNSPAEQFRRSRVDSQGSHHLSEIAGEASTIKQDPDSKDAKGGP